MKKLLAFALALISTCALADGIPPLVVKSGQTQQLRAADTLQLRNIAAGVQCVHADASGNLTGTGADCGAGTVTTTGSPASGNLTKFSGASSITNGDLSGDCTTSGTLAIICLKTNGSAFVASATIDTTNASNISSGTLAAARLPADVAYIDVVQGWTAAQRGVPVTLALGGSTATPNFNTGQNFTLTLVHASCPCTLANPSTTPVAGQTGVVEIIQSATGSDTLAWGTDYTAAGGVSSIVLTTSASARDYLSYYVADSTHIVLSPGVANASH